MKSWERKIVPVGLAVAGLVFLIAAVRPALAGGSLDVTFFLIGVVCAVIAVVAWRKT
ncbi:MAG: hypothetical protein ACYC7A_09940 [Thermoanaerobaculia bacterium]